MHIFFTSRLVRVGVDSDSLVTALSELSEKSWIIEYGPLISAGAILISAGVATRIARVNIREQRKISRRRATLDLLSRNEWDGDYLIARNEFVRLKNGSTGLEFWTAKEHEDSPQIGIIRSVLNDYELIAIGIEEDILDEELYKKWFKSAYIKDYDLSADAIAALRERLGVPAIYKNFEALAKKWKK